MRGILGGYNPIRQISVSQGMPQQQAAPMGYGMMQAGGGESGGYGSDEWALQTGGPGAMLWREIIRGLQSGKHPMSILDPKKGSKNFSPMSLSILGGDYAKGK